MELSSKPIRTRRSKSQIINLLNKFEQSALSVQDFCTEHTIHRATFYKWQTRYKASAKKQSSSESGFAALQISPSPTASVLFAEVKGIKIYQPVAASYLKELSRI